MTEPVNFNQVVGQENIVRELKSIIADDAYVSILLRGQYGMGKTMLARLYASAFSAVLYYATPPGNKLKAYMRATIVDEIHMEKDLELYYPYMTDNKHNMVFCTTEGAVLPGAFKSRCLQFTMTPYTLQQITSIVLERLERDLTFIEQSQAMEIAKRARFNPRVAILLSQRVYRLVKLDNAPFNIDNILKELDRLGIDARGYDDRHRAYLRCLELSSRPVGIKSISMMIGVDMDSITEEIEPTLLQDNLINITSRGRVLNEV